MSHQNFKRTDRVASLLRKDIGQLVHELVREEGLPSMSVSDVEITRDLAHANIFVTTLDPAQAEAGLKALKQGAKELRRELSQRVKLRAVPELHFFYDDSVDRGDRIERLLQGLSPDTELPAEPADESVRD
ncbi:MAG: 30S ribosome-binding factor RbfA [Lysobacterales bacterium]